MNDHEATEIPLKTAVVDKRIQPFIKWLNSFEGIFTTYCCEGTGSVKDTVGAAAYVVFHCDCPLTLAVVLTRLKSFADVYVECYRGQIRYTIRGSLEKLIRAVERKGFDRMEEELSSLKQERPMTDRSIEYGKPIA